MKMMDDGFELTGIRDVHLKVKRVCKLRLIGNDILIFFHNIFCDFFEICSKNTKESDRKLKSSESNNFLA